MMAGSVIFVAGRSHETTPSSATGAIPLHSPGMTIDVSPQQTREPSAFTPQV